MKNICIVGCGTIANLHSKNLYNRANLYFYSKLTSESEKFNKKFKGKKVFENFDHILSSGEIHALILCSPPEFHKEQIIKTLRAGKSVLVEKPMCISMKELDEIEEVYKNTRGLFLMVGENYYYKPSLVKIKELLKEGHIGEVKSIFIKKAFEQKSPGWRTQYGSLLEGGIHFIALLSDIADKSPEKITASFPDYKKGESERSSIVNIEYAGGVTGKLIYSWNTKSLPMGIFQKSYIKGDRGEIIFESNGIYIYLKSPHRNKLYIPNPLDLTGNKNLSTDFLLCLENSSKKPYSDFSRGKRDLNIVFTAYKSASIDPIISL